MHTSVNYIPYKLQQHPDWDNITNLVEFIVDLSSIDAL